MKFAINTTEKVTPRQIPFCIQCLEICMDAKFLKGGFLFTDNFADIAKFSTDKLLQAVIRKSFKSSLT